MELVLGLFFEGALEAEQELGIPVAHETHRQRAMFTPWATSALCREFPELKITADYSHWVCVCERFLEDQEEHLKVTNSRVIHVHGRIGFPEGPQVNDPRAPENAEALQRHEQWWSEIVRERQMAGAEVFDFNPEFGPPGYMHTLPFTGQPVADLWDVCLWMAERFRIRFSDRLAYGAYGLNLRGVEHPDFLVPRFRLCYRFDEQASNLRCSISECGTSRTLLIRRPHFSQTGYCDGGWIRRDCVVLGRFPRRIGRRGGFGHAPGHAPRLHRLATEACEKCRLVGKG